MLGANTNPYQPAERDLRITRSILEVLYEHRHPVGIVTKSSLIERDLDLPAAMAKSRLVRVFISIGTLDPNVARLLEPRAIAPWRRIEVIRILTSRGVGCGVLVAPVIPFVTDKDLEQVLASAGAAGASAAGYVLVRLPHESKGIFREWLKLHYPQISSHVMARIEDMRGGDSSFGQRMRGEGKFAEMIAQ